MAGDDAGRANRVDRHLGQLISISGVMLIAGRLAIGVDGPPDLALWWHAAFASTMLVIGLNAAFGSLLPARALRAGWIAAPIVGLGAGLLTFVAYRGPDPDALDPWQWALASVYVSYLTLWLRPAVAVTCALLAGFVPAIAGLLALGQVPTAAGQLTPIQMSNFAFAVIFIGIRGRWLRHLELEASARDRERERRRAVAEAREDARLARLVHDEVLSTLSAAVRFRGSPPTELREAAHHTLAILRPHPVLAGPALPSSEEIVGRLAEEARRLDPAWRIDVAPEPGPALEVVPGEPAEAILAAAVEAMRNSVLHAGAQVTRRELFARVGPERIVVEITDDGAGFADESVGADRLGLRRSIVDRVVDVPGGSAEVGSRPGEGTKVRLEWRR